MAENSTFFLNKTPLKEFVELVEGREKETIRHANQDLNH